MCSSPFQRRAANHGSALAEGSRCRNGPADVTSRQPSKLVGVEKAVIEHAAQGIESFVLVTIVAVGD